MLAVSVLLLGALVVWWRSQRVLPLPAQETIPADASSPPSVAVVAGEREAAITTVPAVTTTTRQVLEAHFGADAEAALAVVEAKGGDPDEAREVLPWSEVAATIEDRILLSAEERARRKVGKQEWPSDPAKEKAWIEYMFCEGLELPETAFVDVMAVADQHNGRIFDVAREYVEELAMQIEANFRSGDFRSSPIVGLASKGPRDGRPAFYTHSGTAKGWTYSIQVRSGQNPRLDELLHELPRLKGERDRAIRAVLEANGLPVQHRIEWSMNGFY